MENKFDRSKHVFYSEAFAEIIKDTIRFFNGTPIHGLPLPENFVGTGVYALYYTGNLPLYRPLYEMNRLEFSQPIYVGKAVPRGWRQGRLQEPTNELYRRLNDHTNSIEQVDNLSITDFHCRFMILEDAAADMIGTVEAALIRHYFPLWNSIVDGFGNHDPGSGRYEQAMSDWDTIHPGRNWTKRLNSPGVPKEVIEERVLNYFTVLDRRK